MSDYLYSFSQPAMSHRSLLSRVTCFCVKLWQMYHDVSLLECLSKSFLPLKAGRSHGRTSIHELMQKAKENKKTARSSTLLQNSPIFIHKIALELLLSKPSRRNHQKF